MFGVAQSHVDVTARYNIAPAQGVVIARRAPGTARVELVTTRWGFIPAWAPEPDVGTGTISCAIESAETEPAFRDSFRDRRCLIPADGFYVWKDLGSGNRQPILVRVLSGLASERRAFAEPPHPVTFAMGGLWSRWESPDRSPIESVTVLTTTPNEFMSEITDRMPVIVRPGEFDEWLAGGAESVARAREIGRPIGRDLLMAHAVSRRVNSPRLDDERCVEPVSSEPLDG